MIVSPRIVSSFSVWPILWLWTQSRTIGYWSP